MNPLSSDRARRLQQGMRYVSAGAWVAALMSSPLYWHLSSGKSCACEAFSWAPVHKQESVMLGRTGVMALSGQPN